MLVFAYRSGPHVRAMESKAAAEELKLKGQVRGKTQSMLIVIDNLVECIKDRYADMDEGVLRATRIIDFSAWPPQFNECM